MGSGDSQGLRCKALEYCDVQVFLDGDSMDNRSEMAFHCRDNR